MQLLGKLLVDLSGKQLIHIPISGRLKDAIDLAKSMKHGALKRQIKYIGSLMSDEDEASIRIALNKLQQSHNQEVSEFHELEQWRDRLLQDDKDLLNELADKFDNFDRQRVSQLIRNSKKEQTLNKPPKSARLLFKYLAEIKNF